LCRLGEKRAKGIRNRVIGESLIDRPFGLMDSDIIAGCMGSRSNDGEGSDAQIFPDGEESQDDLGPPNHCPPGAGIVRRRRRSAAMKIYQVLAASNFSDPAMLEWVRLEAEYMLKIMEADPNYALPGRMMQVMPPENLQQYFRRCERIEMARCIIQYLLAFLGHIPSEQEVRGDLVDPAEQLRSFVAKEVDLLLEQDVKSAVIEEAGPHGLLNTGSEGDCEKHILLMNRMLKGMLAKRDGGIPAVIADMCRAVEQFALFWFDVHGNDIRRVRRSDICMFLLAHLVRSRCGRLSGA
jgi:hypothetical protein